MSLPRLRVYPSVGDNPYQGMLYSGFSGIADVERLRRGRLLRRWGFMPRAEVLHFHWEDGTFWRVRSPLAIRHRQRIVMRMLDRHRAAGGKLVWTVHNERPHTAGEFHDGFRTLRARLAVDADMIHVHSEAARTMLIDQCAPDPDRIEIIAHPSYVGVYPDAGGALPVKSPGRARFLFFGSLDPYKGVEEMVAAFASPAAQGWTEGLTIAGNASTAMRAMVQDRLADAGFPTDLRFARVADDAVAAQFRATHFCVLPYRRSLTSGVANLALTYGVPVVGPRLGGMAEALPDSCHDLLYDPADPAGLAGALARAAALAPAEYARLSSDCLAVAQDRAPERQSARLAAAMVRRGILPDGPLAAEGRR